MNLHSLTMFFEGSGMYKRKENISCSHCSGLEYACVIMMQLFVLKKCTLA